MHSYLSESIRCAEEQVSLAALNWLVEKAEPILVTYPRLLLLPFRCILDLNGESGESNTRLCVDCFV